MTTQTITLSEPSISIIIEPRLPDYVSAVDSLSKILERYQTWQDNLSQDLFSWGTDVLRNVIEHRMEPPSIIAAIAQERLGVLSSQILVNPLNNSPLQEPVLERKWTWEASLHAECRKLFPVSLFDGQPMSLEPPPHLFAKEIIDWVHLLPALGNSIVRNDSSSPLQHGQMALVSNDPRLAVVHRCVYPHLAQAAIARRQQKELQEKMDYALICFDQCAEQMREENKQLIAETSARAAAHEAALQKQLDFINQTHHQTVEVLNGRMTAIEVQHRKTISALEERLAQTDQANSAAVGALTQQIGALSQEHQIAIVDLERQVDQANQQHGQTVSILENQLQSATRVHQAAMESLAETHQRTVSVLQSQIVEGEDRLHQTRGQLEQASVCNAQNVREIQNLRSAYVQAQQQIIDLQNQDSSCTIL